MTSWSDEQLNELIEQATVDCYDEEVDRRCASHRTR